MRTHTPITLALLLTLTACTNTDTAQPNPEPTPTEQPTSSQPATPEPTMETTEPVKEDTPPMDNDTAPLPDGTLPPNQTPLGQPAYQAIMYMGDTAPVEWETTLTDFHCDVDIELLNNDFADLLLDPYTLRDGHTLCAATITYENIGTIPGTYPEPPAGIISDGALYEQTADYSLFVINDAIMNSNLGGPFNPGTTFTSQTLIEVPDSITVDAVYLAPDDTQVATHLLVK